MRISKLGAGLLLVASALVSVAGCDSSTSTVDSGTPGADSGMRDAGTEPDAQAGEDAGPGDAGAGDAGPTDGGPPPIDTTPRRVEISAAGHDRLYDLAFDDEGNIYAIGHVADGTDAMTDFRTVVARFEPDGALDTTWATMGYATHNLAVGTSGEVARGIDLQSSGLVVGVATIEHAGASDARDRDVAVFRLTSTGALDTTFGDMGVRVLDLSDGEVSGMSYIADAAWNLAVDSMDRIVVHASRKRDGTTDTDYVVARLTEDGALDTEFSGDGLFSLDLAMTAASTRSVAVLADDRIVASGYRTEAGVVVPVVYVLTTAGELDTSFGGSGVFSDVVLAAATEAYAVLPHGTGFVTAGYGRELTTESLDWLSLRFTAMGELDEAFGTDGVARVDFAMFNDNARDLAVLDDMRIVVVGGARSDAMTNDGAIAVLEANGALDTDFDTDGRRVIDLGGAGDMLWAIANSADRLAIVGQRAGVTGEDDDSVLIVMPLP